MAASSEPRSAYDDDYFTVLRAIHRYARPRSYLEIGVWKGESLRLATPSTRAVGVDPRPQIEGGIPRRWSVFAETSDAFFARPDVAAITGPVDIAFIDGLHYYEQALRDFAHVERLMAPDGVVLFHDCLPPDAESAGRTVTPGCWAGDVWKVIPILAEHRPDLTITVAAAAPSGLGIVTGLDPSSQVLDEHFDEIVGQYADVPFAPWPQVRRCTWSELGGLFPEYRGVQVGDELRRKTRTMRTVVRRRFGRDARRHARVTVSNVPAPPGDPDEVVPPTASDALPEDLDVTAYVGPYQFPGTHRRRIAGTIYLGLALFCGVVAGATANEGLVAGAVLLAVIGGYHYLAAWHLRIDQTEALTVASRTVGFPVGHASGQLGFRGLRSRPSWRILLFSADDPPSMRGLVELDGVDGRVLGEYTELNPEDWSAYGLDSAGGEAAR